MQPIIPKCQCRKMLGYSEDKILYVHLYGCPNSPEFAEYNLLPKYKKIFTKNPYEVYLYHLIKY